MGPVTSAVLLVLAAGVYFAPSVVAYARAVPGTRFIFVVNLAAGWTLIGWGWALARALRRPPAAPCDQAAAVRPPRTWRSARRSGLSGPRPGSPPPLRLCKTGGPGDPPEPGTPPSGGRHD